MGEIVLFYCSRPPRIPAQRQRRVYCTPSLALRVGIALAARVVQRAAELDGSPTRKRGHAKPNLAGASGFDCPQAMPMQLRGMLPDRLLHAAGHGSGAAGR